MPGTLQRENETDAEYAERKKKRQDAAAVRQRKARSKDMFKGLLLANNMKVLVFLADDGNEGSTCGKLEFSNSNLDHWGMCLHESIETHKRHKYDLLQGSRP